MLWTIPHIINMLSNCRRRAFVKDSSMRIVKGGKVEKRGNKKGKKWVGRRIPQPSIYNYYNT